MTTLSISQLNAALTSEQIGAARSRSLVSTETGEPLPDPVLEEIDAACAKVDTYTAGWLVPESLRTSYARDIAAWAIAKRLSNATEDQGTARERALKELEEIRDGKFPGIARDPAATPPELPAIRTGSRTKVL